MFVCYAVSELCLYGCSHSYVRDHWRYLERITKIQPVAVAKIICISLLSRCLRTSFQRPVITREVKFCSYCCYVIFVTLIVGVEGMILTRNKRNLFSWTIGTSRQRSSNQKVGLLLNLTHRVFGQKRTDELTK